MRPVAETMGKRDAFTAFGTVSKAAFKQPDKDALRGRSGDHVAATTRRLSSSTWRRAPIAYTSSIEAVGAGVLLRPYLPPFISFGKKTSRARIGFPCIFDFRNLCDAAARGAQSDEIQTASRAVRPYYPMQDINAVCRHHRLARRGRHRLERNMRQRRTENRPDCR